MNRQRMFTVALAVLLVLTVCGSAFSRRVKQIPGFRVVKEFPRVMAAGSSYEMELMFVNPKSEKLRINIVFEVETREGVALGDFFLEGVLYMFDIYPKKHNRVEVSFDEVSGGVFQSDGWTYKRFNRLALTVSLGSNLASGDYVFTLTVTLQYKAGRNHSWTIRR